MGENEENPNPNAGIFSNIRSVYNMSPLKLIRISFNVHLRLNQTLHMHITINRYKSIYVCNNQWQMFRKAFRFLFGF